MTVAALELYERGLAAAGAREPGRYRLRSQDGALHPLPLARWVADADPTERAVLAAVTGPVLDVGCGPGRHVRALHRRGVEALGIDISPNVVALARRTGARAIQGSVFAPVPGQGHWRSALLLDGNLGIGGDPQRLLGRVAELLAPQGSAYVEFEPSGVSSGETRMRIESSGRISEWFRWARVSIDEAPALASAAGFRLAGRWRGGGRRFARLVREGG